jgi:hypothetical protein
MNFCTDVEFLTPNRAEPKYACIKKSLHKFLIHDLINIILAYDSVSLKIGDRVNCLDCWNHKCLSSIVDIRDDAVFVGYDNWSAKYNEWVSTYPPNNKITLFNRNEIVYHLKAQIETTNKITIKELYNVIETLEKDHFGFNEIVYQIFCNRYNNSNFMDDVRMFLIDYPLS